jgi:LysW-gamma-L-lysine carboxypeptidase
MDTFPGTPPVRIDNCNLYGRGSVDAKGPLAAFLLAAARAAPHLTSRVLVIGAVEEETTTSRGARHIASAYTPDACIVGEPSGTSGYTIGYKGRLVVDLRVARSGAHSAGPGGSAADAAFDWWTRVLADVEHLNTGRTGAFDRLQASIRSTTSTHDGITDVATLLAGFRLPTWINPGDLVARLPTLPDGASLSINGAERAIRVDRSSSVARALSGAIRAHGLSPTPLVKTGTSDMNVVGATWTCPIAAYGPGDSNLDHTPNEHLPIADYLTAINILQHALTSGTL